jgi:hypothetical protein
MRVLKIVGGVLAVMVLGVVLLFLGARFKDGPIGLIPGGPLESGELVTGPVADWGFARDVETIELQLDQDDISRTTWILVDDEGAYVPCSLGFPPGKDWYRRADRRGDAVVRIEGRRYPVLLERVKDDDHRSALLEIARAKYGGGPPSDAEVWFFALRPRTS